jgi:hypothetical protein
MTSIITAIIAAFVAYIGWLQWRTAEEKVRLDLFDRRFALYDELRAIVDQYGSGGVNQTEYLKFKAVSSRARFLFGPEVTSFLEATAGDLAQEIVQWAAPRPVSEDKREEAEAQVVARMNRINRFSKDLDELVAPYMRHQQSERASGWWTSWLEQLARLKGQLWG